MIYNITQNFQRLGITSGTVQNTWIAEQQAQLILKGEDES